MEEGYYQEDESSTQSPTSPTVEDDGKPTTMLWNCGFPPVTRSVVKEALVRHVLNHPGCKKKFVKQIKLSRTLSTEGICIYKLETFGEMRTKGVCSTAYNGSSIDSDASGAAPRIWDIPVSPQTFFKDSEVTLDIPHTEYVKRCTTCRGYGYTECARCKGAGSVFCETCWNNAPLMFQGDPCFFCRRWGNGGLVMCCKTCRGNREIKCKDCEGCGLCKQRETLTVTWINKVSEVAHKECLVPFMKLTQVAGKTIICEENEILQPLVYSPLFEVIGSKSERLLRKHRGAFPSILRQRHSLRLVPVTKVRYTWKGKAGEFHIYGLENKVYFKHFPCKWTDCSLL